jgi:hypothetical protein
MYRQENVDKHKVSQQRLNQVISSLMKSDEIGWNTKVRREKLAIQQCLFRIVDDKRAGLDHHKIWGGNLYKNIFEAKHENDNLEVKYTDKILTAIVVFTSTETHEI